ncbi:Helix-turn-helix domain-containing protein [Pedobacter sp. ok626]|uniref:helix-turn-helix domain-containing protein n=1 Tax=Pedobacter sp. ok626 TaxID=1761882 RepID=UPI0008842E0E|nr:helix-turn-helix domain-containing protein [Pedobacter sp. ok626]SDK58760.1 Helix-turn-helix domain-containing protein [Pedobacter sp. ok626]
MGDLPMTLDEFRKEFKRLFDQKADEFFKRIFEGMKPPENKDAEQSLMTTNQVTAYFDISRTTLNNWINKDKIMSIKKGNQRFFDRAYIERYKKINFSFDERLPTYYSKHV